MSNDYKSTINIAVNEVTVARATIIEYREGEEPKWFGKVVSLFGDDHDYVIDGITLPIVRGLVDNAVAHILSENSQEIARKLNWG